MTAYSHNGHDGYESGQCMIGNNNGFFFSLSLSVEGSSHGQKPDLKWNMIKGK